MQRIKIGSIFGRLLVKAKSEPINFRPAWLCLCSCGKQKAILAQSLKSGSILSCGCLHKEILIGLKTKHQQKAGEAIGKKFGLWQVIDLTPLRSKNGGVYFLCKCECGQIREVTSDSLTRGTSKSCGNCGADKKPICKNGHVVADWGGRTPSSACKACVKQKSLFNNYGITLEEYLALGDSQEWKCAICGKKLEKSIGLQGFGRQKEGRAEVDHEHGGKSIDKKYVRGLLCGGRWAGCNRKIGRIDNIEWLSNVLTYLKNPPAQQLFKNNSCPSPNSL